MSRLRSVQLDPILDSRGHWTVEATVVLDSGAHGRAGAPSGASTGVHEARAFPPGGVPEALRTFAGKVRPALLGAEADLAGVDALLHRVDPTPEFLAIGGNTSTAVSLATALALSDERGLPLWRLLARPGVNGSVFPAVVGNCLNGGRHALGGPDIQEFHAIARGRTPEESVRAALRVHTLIGEALRRRQPDRALGRGDEGGWVASIGNLEALDLLAEACTRARDELKIDVTPGLDLAASEFCHEGKYRYREQTLDGEGQLGFVAGLVDRYGLTFLEDPFDQEAFDLFAQLTRAVGSRVEVVGDDLFVSRKERLEEGIARGSTNAILIKVNQTGTLTDTMATVDLARSRDLATVTSHRSGDLPEGWLPHVALASGARGLKCGLLGGERAAKLNELLRLGRAAST